MRTHQVIHFVEGSKRTLFNIVGVKDNEFCHLMLEDGRKVLINRDNVLMIEIFNDHPRGVNGDTLNTIAHKTWGNMFNIYSANESNIPELGQSKPVPKRSNTRVSTTF